MNTELKKVAIYARVSSNAQDVDLSISAQLKALRDYANQNGYMVIREFIDEAETGRTAARPAFRQMISLARSPQKPFEVILVWKFSRFARNREDSIVHKAMLRKNGVQVVSINEPVEDTPTGRLLEAFIESLDEYYSDNLGEEVTRGMRESASRGFYLSVKPPYGYRKIRIKDGDKERTKLEIDPEQANVINLVFNEILKGKGLIQIAKELNGKGIASPKNRTWGKTTLRVLVSNEAYTGTIVWGRNSKRGFDPIRVENACPVIIEKTLFDKVQETIQTRAFESFHPKRSASNYLLSGLAYCGYCGKAMTGTEAKSGKFSYYVCGTINHKGAGSCKAKYWNSKTLEANVVRNLKEGILSEENLTKVVEMVNQDVDEKSIEYQNEFNIILQDLNDANQRLERLYDAVETGKIPFADLAPRIHDLKARQDKLQERKLQLEADLSDRRVVLASPETVRRFTTEMRKVLETSEFTEKKSFIRGIVKKIKILGDQAVFEYVPPFDEIIAKKYGVLCIEQDGGR
jgi:site-specific DNA recombinase